MGYFSWSATRELNTTFDGITQRTIPIIDAVNDLRYYASRALNHANELALILSPSHPPADENYRIHQEQELENAFAQYRTSLGQYQSLVQHRAGEGHQDVLGMIVSTSETLQGLIRELVAAGRRGASAEELFVKTEQIEAYELTFLYAVDAALASEVQRLHQRRDALHQTIANTRNIAVVFGPVSVVIAALIAMYFSSAVTSVLQRLKNASLAVAAGNWNTRVPRMGKGEFDDVIQTFNDMAAALHSKAADARAIREHCHEILDTMSESVIVTGLDGKIETANSATERQLRLSEADLTGRSVEELFGQGYREQVREVWLPMLARGGNIPHAKVSYVDKDKQEVAMIVSASSMPGRDGIIDGLVFKAIPETELDAAFEDHTLTQGP